jgi:hypothetical protein
MGIVPFIAVSAHAEMAGLDPIGIRISGYWSKSSPSLVGYRILTSLYRYQNMVPLHP